MVDVRACRAAGITVSGAAPAAAFELVEICGRLPLALDIAGKLLAELGLTDISSTEWEDVPAMLRQEMSQANAAASDVETLEYKVIGASLRKIPPQDRAAVQTIFGVFAIVAEDTHVPPSAFRLMFNALSLSPDGEAVSGLQLRKWMQMLINRSLVLGSWERPQVSPRSQLHRLSPPANKLIKVISSALLCNR